MTETILERLAKLAPRKRVDEDAQVNGEINRLLAKIKRGVSKSKNIYSARGGLTSMGARGPVVKEGGIYNQRVIVKASYVLPDTRHARTLIRHHLHYAAHNKTDVFNKSPELYCHDDGSIDIKEKINDFQKAPHFFNIIISPENGDELDLKEFTRSFVAKVEADLGTKLDWAAGNHYDTNDPHVHLLFKGEDEHGKKLILTRDYISRGLRARASQVATTKLGLRSRDEVIRSLEFDVLKPAKTDLDKIILRASHENRIDLPNTYLDELQDLPKELFQRRLEFLETKDLVKKECEGVWHIDADLIKKLKELSRTSSIIERLSGDLKINNQACEIISAKNLFDQRVKGYVVERGFVDDHSNKEYLVVKSKEKKFLYVELEKYSEKTPAKVGEFIQIEGTKPFSGPKTSDGTILNESKNNGGIYDAARHAERASAQGLLPPSVTAKEYADVHVKRLEILASKGLIEKLDDQRFVIPSEYIEKLTHEAKKSEERFIAHIKVTRLSPSRLSSPTLNRGLGR
jgi:type IV secretory pathway VirD2 relaxase